MLLTTTTAAIASNTDASSDAPWPAYYKPTILTGIVGTRKTGDVTALPKGYVLHRKDMERINVALKDGKQCAVDRDRCEKAASDAAKKGPSFFNTIGGHILVAGLAFLCGGALVFILDRTRD